MGRNFDRAVRAQLIEGSNGDRFGVAEEAEPLLRAALARDLKEANVAESVVAGLRLAAAFDGELGSPGLASLIRELLRSSPAAIAAIRGTQRQDSPLDATRRFVLREGREVALLAPNVSATTPQRSIPLRALFDLGARGPRGQHRKSG
ncbi:MAG: hypothetical protein IPG45_08840 [Deltaproteobacteria bacterium]|nr:hypothetical protein [Deltaproteobacteria bacterium]